MTDEYCWDYHVRQYNEMYRSTSSIISFLKSKVPRGSYSVIDVGCGGGANIHWLKKSFPDWKFLGIDIDKKAIDLAKELNRHEKDVRFEKINLSEITEHFPAKSFDYVLAIQFISFLDSDFPVFLEKAFYLARKGIFITSLFSDGWIEQHSIAHDIEKKWKGIYKIYSLERFKEKVKGIGGKNVGIELEKFEIDIDIPKPRKPMFGTYTIKTENGGRLQVSGHMLMPWYNILITLKEG